ncbi:MAG TPA: penicillin-binding protein 2 [Spirochaetota bacterium]|nr:penicillin-binding protein 2 [Spirochaetota bacterium]
MDGSKRTIAFWFILTALGFMGIIIRVWYVSTPGNLNLPRWKSQSRPEIRGAILDRNGSPIALTVPAVSIFVRPDVFLRNTNNLARLATTLGLTSRDCAARIQRGTRQFAWIIRQASPETGDRIRGLRIPGLETVDEPSRIYPHGDLASQLVGFCGVDHTGLSGLEKSFDKILLPTKSSGTPIRNIVLTIDRYMQYIAEEELATAIRETEASHAVAIIFQPQTGEILSMAALPGFDPNRFAESPQERYINPIVSSPYEPGSTFKIFSAAWLLENGLVSENEHFHCPGAIEIHGHSVECTHPHGTLNLHGILTYSCNVGMIQLAQRVKAGAYRSWLGNLGFGIPTGISLPGEASGILRPVQKWSGLSRYMLSIGYECSVTPLQLVRAASALATGGVLMQPVLVKAVTDHDGHILEASAPAVVRRVLKPSTTTRIMAMLRNVVVAGTGIQANLGELEAGGKTGTAYVAKAGGGGYYKTRYTASFMGFLPWKNSNLAILVMIYEPRGQYEGGTLAAPVFRRIARRTLLYLNQKLPPVIDEQSMQRVILPGLTESQRNNLLRAYKRDSTRKRFILSGELTDHQKTELSLILQSAGQLQ